MAGADVGADRVERELVRLAQLGDALGGVGLGLVDLSFCLFVFLGGGGAVVCCVVAARAPSSSSLQPPPSLPQLARATLTTQRPTRTAGHNHNNDHDSSNNKHSTFFKNFR